MPQSFGPSLEDDLAHEAQVIDELLGEFYAEQVDGVLVDQSVELEYGAAQLQYLYTLSRIMGGDSTGYFLPTHGAYHFAISLAGMLNRPIRNPGAAMIDFEGFSDDVSDDEVHESLMERAAIYLEDKAELAAVIDIFSADYCRMADDSFNSEAQAICALTCEAIEQHVFTKHEK